MEKFRNKILSYDLLDDKNILLKKGVNPVLLSAPHAAKHIFDDGSIKLSEPMTKNIVAYVADMVNGSYIIKNYVSTIDANHSDDDEYKNIMLNMIKENNIKLVLDIHGADINNIFDIEIGTLNNLTADYSTINELIDAFNENGIFNITCNSKFKGGKITQKIYFETSIDIIQIEINRAYRDYNNIENLKKVCDALCNFINMYLEIIK